MDAPKRIPPEIQQVEDFLQEAAQREDWEACDRFLAGLAAEAELGRVTKDAAELKILEIEEDIETFPEISEKAMARIRELQLLKMAGEIAVFRRQHAAILLHQLKNGYRL